jgi:hypothetical protein
MEMQMDLPLARIRRALLLGGVVILALGLTAARGEAAGLSTTTVLSSSPTAISGTQTASLSATVSPWMLVLPQTVTFANSTTGKTITTVSPTLTCLVSLRPCTFAASVPASSLATGQNAIVAKYSGDLLEAPSQGTAYVYKGTVTTCSSGPESYGCFESTKSADGTAEGSIYTQSPASGQESITIAFGTAPLPCTTPGTGDTMAFTVTNAGSAKSIRYEVFGAAAEAAEAAHPNGHVCYESPNPFKTASGAAATRGSNGLYYGVLPTCEGGGDEGPATNPPCLEFSYYNSGEGEGTPVFVDYLEVPLSDPRVSN